MVDIYDGFFFFYMCTINIFLMEVTTKLQQSLTEPSDEAHYKYIQEAINSAFAAHGQRKKPKGNMNTGGRTSPDGSPCPPMAQGKTVTASTTPLPSTSPAHQHNVSLE